MLAVAQQVIHQQLFGEGLQRLGQLGKKHPEVFQHFLARQRFASRLDTDARAIDQIQPAALAQQIVQMQVFLPQAFAVQLTNRAQCIGQDRRLLIRQQGQLLDLLPGLPQALGAFKVIKQQPAALAFFQAVGQQLRRGQALGGEQTHAIQFTLKMPCSLATNQQFGQYRPTAPDSGADITLPGQDPQQAQ
ncbi:hypothetical protein D3C87_1490010 [compost metagenome]